MFDVATLGIEVDSRQVPRAARDLEGLSRSGGVAEASMQGLKRAAAAAFAGIASFQVFRGATQHALEFNSAIAETATLLGGIPEEIAAVERASRELAKSYGGSAQAQAQAFYQAISGGAGNAAEATQLLDTANRLAIGGVTSVTTGVDALTTVMGAYGREAMTVESISDTLFVGMKQGKTTVGELGAQLGQVVPIAASAGISFEEVVGATSALTTQGLSTSAAVTGLRQVMASVISPTKQASDMAAELGLGFDSQALAAKGLSGFLEDVIAKTGGNQEAMAQLFGSVEALNAVLAFSGGAGGKFNAIMEEMAVKTGATSAAFKLMAEDDAQRLSQAFSKFADLGITLGNTLLTVAVPAVELVADNLDILVAGGTAAALVFTSSMIPSLVTMGVSAVGAAAGFVTLKGAMIASGVGALVVGLGSAIYWFNKLVVATGSWGAALSALGQLASGVWQGIKTSAASLGPALGSIWHTVQSGFFSMLEFISEAWSSFLGNMAASVEGVRGMGAAYDLLSDASGAAAGRMSEFNAKATSASSKAASLKQEANGLAQQGWARAAEALKTLTLQMDVANAEMDGGENASDALKKALEELEAQTDSTGGALGGSLAGGLDQAEEGAKRLADALNTPIVNAVDQSVDYMLDGFQGGFDGVLNIAKSALNDIIKFYIMNPIRVSMGVGGIAAPASAAAGSGVVSTQGGAGSGLLGGLVGSSGLLGGIGGGVQAALGLGSYASAGLFNIGANAATAAAATGASAFASTIGAALPVLGIAGVLISGLIGKTKVLNTGLRVTVDEFDALVQTFTTKKKTKFWGLISSTKTNFGELSADEAAPIVNAVSAIQMGVVDMASMLDVGAGAFAGFASEIDISLQGLTDEEKAQAIQEALAGIGDEMAALALAGHDVMREGEGATETLSRLSSSLAAVNAVMDTLGHHFGGSGISGGSMASSLVDMFGGLDAFNAATTTFYSTMYSDAERLDVVTRQTADALSVLGLTLPQSRAEFRAIVGAIDLTTESGRAMYAELVSLSGALDQVLPSVSGFTETISGLVAGTSSLVQTMMGETTSLISASERAAQQWYAAADNLRDLILSLTNSGSSSLSGAQRVAANRAQVQALFAAAQGGDVDAARGFGGAAQDYLASVLATASSATEYRRAEAQVRAQAKMLAGISELEGASQDVIVSLAEQQLSVLTDLNTYMQSTDSLSPDDLAGYVGTLENLGAAIKEAEMFSYEYLRERLQVTVDLLPTAQIPEDLRRLIATATNGIESTISFAVQADDLTPDLRWLAVTQASHHLSTIDFALGDTLDGKTARLALLSSGEITRSVNAVMRNGLSVEEMRLALAGSSELARVVNVSLASGADPRAIDLALRNASSFAVTVRAALSANGEVRQIVFGDAGAYAAMIEAAFSTRLTSEQRRILLRQQGDYTASIRGIMARGVSPAVSSLLLTANTAAIRTVTLDAVFASGVTRQERALMDLVSGASAGRVVLGGDVVFDPSSAFDQTVQSGIATPMTTLTSSIGDLIGALRDQEAAVSASAAASKQTQIDELIAGLQTNNRGMSFMNEGQIRALAGLMGVDQSGTLGDVMWRVQSHDMGDALRRIHYDPTGAAERNFLAGTSPDAGAKYTFADFKLYDADPSKTTLVGPMGGSLGPMWRSQALKIMDDVIFGNIPAFADGGEHAGGLRIVGERGIELEATGPAKIYSHAQTKDLLSGGGEVQRELLAEIKAMRDEQRQLGIRADRHERKIARILEKWDVDGQPPEKAT